MLCPMPFTRENNRGVYANFVNKQDEWVGHVCFRITRGFDYVILSSNYVRFINLDYHKTFKSGQISTLILDEQWGGLW